jgi:hypothetical protein
LQQFSEYGRSGHQTMFTQQAFKLGSKGLPLAQDLSPPADWYKDNTGSFLLDVFVYDNKNKAAFQQFLQALIRQNPEDTAFVAQAQGFLK